jgi:hypothetical protein
VKSLITGRIGANRMIRVQCDVGIKNILAKKREAEFQKKKQFFQKNMKKIKKNEFGT